jgi:PAS domain S-box-containing protein
MNNERRAPLSIALMYALAGALWIFLSEKLLVHFVATPEEMALWETCKGWLFVAVTSCLLYWLVHGYMKRLIAAREALEKENREYRLVQAALMESEEQFHNMFTKHSAIMYLVDPDTLRIFDANEAAQKFYGYSAAEFKNLKISDLNPMPAEEIREIFGESRRNEYHYIFKHRLACGEVRDVEIYSTPIRLTERKFLFSIVHDITERKRAEELLVFSEHRFRAFFENSTDALFLMRDDEFFECNPAALGMFGYGCDVLISNKPFSFSPPVQPDGRESTRAAAEYLSAALDGEPQQFEWKFRRHDGVLFDASVIMNRFDVDGNTFLKVSVREITEQKRSENALRESEARFRSLVEATSDWIWEIDENDVFVYSSPKVKDFLGFEPCEVIGKTPFDLLPANEVKEIKEFFHSCKKEAKAFSGLENRNVHKDGRIVVMESSGVPICDSSGRLTGYRGIDRDITGHKQLEEQLLHAQKMEAIGELAGGIAHDFNNILTAIMGYVYILQIRIKDEALGKYVEQINYSAQRAASLVGKLLAFSRKQIICLHPVKINETIRRAENLLSRVIREDIEIRTGLSDEELIVLGDEGQIEQVIMNLATNAQDAMPSGGTLTIQSGRCVLDREFVHVHGYGNPGTYAVITFVDTGCGMDEKTRERIFEPFFTTKEIGKGTGLGLSIVYGIIKQHDGYIDVSSMPGKGSTFSVYLPLGRKTPEKTVTPMLSKSAGGSGTILVGEDDADARRFIKTILEEFGYFVIEAVNGSDAIEKYSENIDRIRLVVLDVVMPRKNGMEAYAEMRKTNPDIKTIFLSGYPDDILDARNIPEDGAHFMEKPVEPWKLLEKIKSLLD